MNPTEHIASPASTSKNGLNAALRRLLHVQKSGRAVVMLSFLAAVLGVLALATAPAFAAPPTIEAESESASEVTADSATLHATVDPNGTETTYHFQYGTSEAYGQSTPESLSVGSDDSSHPVAAHIQGLQAGITYHYRILATSSQSQTGGTPGPDQILTTQHTGSTFTLPDGRQYEMVTPPEKEGALFRPLEFSDNRVMQASARGDAIADVASQPTEAEPKGSDEEVSVLSTRGLEGWSSQDIEGEHDELGSLILGEGNESRFFSEDLSHVVTQQLGEFTPLSPEASEPTPYLRTDYFNGNVAEHCEGSYLTTNSCFQPLVTRANTRKGAEFGEVANGVCPRFFCGPHFVDGTPDLSHIILETETQLTPSLPAGWAGDYEWSAGKLQALPGILATPGSNFDNNAIGTSHAISADGGRVILEDGLFDAATGELVRLDAPEPGCGTCSSGSNLGFQTANSDDSRIFFLDSGPLTAEHSAAGADLYECEIVEVAGKLKCNLTNLTPSVGAGEMLGVSEDGSYAYFTAGAGLAPGSAQGTCNADTNTSPEMQGCNVYVRHDGVTRLVAPDWLGEEAPNRVSELVRVSPNGRWLAFMSRRRLTGYDNRDAASGQPDMEVYLYHAETSPSGMLELGKLACASCDPTGAQPSGLDEVNGYSDGVKGWIAGILPPWEQYGSQGNTTIYQPRYLSDGGKLFFDSLDALVPQDVNGVEDVYEYEPEGALAGEHTCSASSTSGSEVFKPARTFEAEAVKNEDGAGCVALLSSGTSSEPSSFIDASQSGGDVFFITTSKLTTQDFDSAPDVYDAHECTSESPCAASVVTSPPCTTEASCKAPPTPQPGIYGLPASATFSGPGNITPPPLPAPAKKVTTKTIKCKKGLTKNKKGKCIKNKRRPKTKKASNHRRSK